MSKLSACQKWLWPVHTQALLSLNCFLRHISHFSRFGYFYAFSHVLGKDSDLSFSGTIPGFLACFSSSFRGAAKARLFWETGLPHEAERGEISLYPIHFRSLRMTFHYLSLKAKDGLLSSPSLFSLPLQNITHFKTALCLKNSQHLALPAYRSSCDDAREGARWGKKKLRWSMLTVLRADLPLHREIGKRSLWRDQRSYHLSVLCICFRGRREHAVAVY